MGQAARAAGLNRVFEFLDVDSAASAVKSFLKPGDVVLLKASRSVKIERVSEALRAGEEEKQVAVERVDEERGQHRIGEKVLSPGPLGRPIDEVADGQHAPFAFVSLSLQYLRYSGGSG